MKKLLLLCMCAAGLSAYAQTDIINTIAGTGTAGFSGDGGPASGAMFYGLKGIAIDNAGNLFLADYNNKRIRKIDPSGIITTIAGNGTAATAGDGGPATAAQLDPGWVAADNMGNIFVIDYSNNRVRKINAAGIITTVAGTGTVSYSGDGGPATNATLGYPNSVACDNSGNIYIADYQNNRIRKVDATGMISTFAGNGVGGYSGDSVMATTAHIAYPFGVSTDNAGNVYITDATYCLVRRVRPDGIIQTIAGNGTCGYSGDGGSARSAMLNYPINVATDLSGNLYISDDLNNKVRLINSSGNISTFAGGSLTAGFSGDCGPASAAVFHNVIGVVTDNNNNLYINDDNNYRIRKVNAAPTLVSGSFTVYTDNYCDGIRFHISANSYAGSQHVTTYFGDNTSEDVNTTNCGGNGVADFYKSYASSGVYTIKHVLYSGTTAVDSIVYSHTVSLCQSFALKFYYDMAGTCVYNPTADAMIVLPLLVEVDSNGVAIDTLSATSGLYYTARGLPGDIYSFRIISHAPGFTPSCPVTGIVSDTLREGANSTLYFGFNCTAGSAFDLQAFSSSKTGVHMQTWHFTLDNTTCVPETSTFTMNISPKYVFQSSYPLPASVVGNVATWNLGVLSTSMNALENLSVTLKVPGAFLSPGDTIMTNGVINPVSGDSIPLSNFVEIIDTVRNSYDPNEMAVSPGTCLTPGVVTPLQYTIMFENTGNDTAHNIFILDTLSDNLDLRSLRIVTASANMNTSNWYDPIYHNIVKFEFPGINLLDSSHHDQCDGMVIFNINTIAGMVPGTSFNNEAGIYFDDNAVVMTNEASTTVCGVLAANSLKTNTTVKLYPNPANDQITLVTDGITYGSCVITDIVGSNVMEQAITHSKTQIDISGLSQGVYFVTLKGNNETVVRKFVKL